MKDLKFLGLRKNGEILTTSNRNFTTSEEADISNFSYQGVGVEVYDSVAKLHMVDDIMYNVQVFAVADNVYVAHQIGAGNIYLTENLRDCLAAAAEMLYGC